MVVQYTYLVSPDFNPDLVPEGYTWDVDAFQELVKATDKAAAAETIYVYGGPQGGADVDYLNAADLTISNLKYDGDGQVVGTTVTANAFNNTGTVTTDGAIIFSVKSFTNFGEFDLDKNGVLTATSAVMNMEGGTINLNAGTTLQGTMIGNAGTITVVSDHATINGAITNHGIINATKRKLIVVGDLQNAHEDDTAEARDNTVITAREFEVTGNVVNYGILGTEMQPDHQIDISGELRNYRQIEVGILTAGSIYSDGYYPEIEEKCTRGYIIAGEVNAGSIDNVSGVIQTAAPKETAVGINVTGTINNGNADGIIAKLNAGLNGWIKAATLNNLGNDIENENGLIIAGRLTVGDITNNGGISTRIVESTGTITNNATGLFAVTYINDPTVTGLVEGASINAGTIINGGTFAVYSEAALPTAVTVTSIENSGLFEFTGVGFTLTGDIFNKTEGQLDVAGTVTGGTGSITNSGTLNISNDDDVSGVLITAGTVTNAKTGTINLNAGTTLQGTTIGNAGTITVVSDHATINGAITNHGIINATKRKLIVVGDLQNAHEDDTAEARDNTVITAREFEVTGNVVNYGILGTEMQPDHQIDISGELRNYRQIEVGILTAGSIYSDGYYPEIEEKCTRGYIIAGEVNAGSIDNVSGVIQTAAPKETAVGINVTGTINNGNADGIIAKLNAGLNGWIKAATLNNLGNDIENENGLIIAGRLTVGDITNNGGISTRIVESTGTITNNATGLFAVTYINDPTVTGLVEGASINAGTIINGGTFAVYSEAALPTAVTVTSIENSGLFEFTGVGFTLTGDIFNKTEGQLDVAGTVTGGTSSITNSGTLTINGSLTAGAISGGGTIQITVKPADPIAVTADVSGNVIDLEVTLASLTENSYQFVSGTIGEGVTFQVNGTVYEEGVLIDGTDYVLSTMGGTGLWMVREPDSIDFLTGDFTGSAEDQMATVVYNDISEGRSSFVTIYSNGAPWGNGLTVDPGWEIAGVGDFNADGQDDILRVSTEGYVVGEMTQPDGSFAAQVLNFLSPGWSILGTGDFNGNGTDDILIANPTAASETVGLLGYWESGVTWTLINGYSAEWEMIATGDYNGDGKCDMLWKNSFEGEGGLTYNAYCTWIMDNPVDWRMVSVANPAEWNFLCSGDFDADGCNDIAMINNEGVVGIWGVGDGYLNSWSILSAVDTSTWTLVGVGDFNADGTDDIAWANTDTGLVGYWQINDKQLTDWQTLAILS